MKTKDELLAMRNSNYDTLPFLTGFNPDTASEAVSALTEKLDSENIRYSIISLWDGWAVLFDDILGNNGLKADVVLHGISHGRTQNLFESMGFPDDFLDVTGSLTIEAVMDKIHGAMNNNENINKN